MMSLEENKAIVCRVWDEVVSRGTLGVADELIAPEFIYHAPGTPELHGPDGFAQLIAMYRAAFPDLQATVEDLIAEGDKVVSRYTVRGTHQGELMGIPRTGRRVTEAGIVISRLADGKLVEDWHSPDTLGLLQQLGAIPPLGPSGS
ncbi:MAG: ester cyclase [Chloroflexota bacterium]|nr:ester cyclase [Chloroflexota bacterium]